MDIKKAADVIRNTVSMEWVLNYYGYTTKHGFMRCPFHDEKTASLKVYNNGGWHCFGCGKGGSVIDFVMKQENCSFSTAIKAINATFKLGLEDNDIPIRSDARKQKLYRSLDEMADSMLDWINAVEQHNEDTIRLKLKQVQAIEEKPQRDRAASECDTLLMLLDEMQYLEYKKQLCEEKRTLIMEWRRKCHRTASQSKAG